MSRIACLYVPLFPLAARLRAEPELGGEALAVTEGSGAAARVIAASRAARKLGIRAGMTLAQSRAIVPKLAARSRDAACERSAHEALLEIAASCSPRVESDADPASGLVFLDVESPGAVEGEIGRKLARAARAEGFPAAGVGIAASKLAATVAAREAGERSARRDPSGARDPDAPRVIAGGEEAAFLAPLPLARLTPELGLARTLERWGLASIGDFARLPAAEVSSRLGSGGTRLHAVARGVDARPLLAREPPPDLSEGLELEWPLVTLEPFLFVAYAALERLAGRLETRALGCARLALELALDPSGRDARAWDLPAPTRDAKTLLTIVRLDLETRPPGAPVVAFTLTAIPGRVRAGQGTLFGPPALSPERLATTLARLFALLGSARVGSPRPVDGHRPERFALVPFAPPPPPLRAFDGTPAHATGASRSAHGVLAVRTLRPAIELEVEVGTRPGDGEPAPLVLRTLPHEIATKRPEIAGRVRVAAGPWRLEEGWWHASDWVCEGAAATDRPESAADRTIDREYWDVELDPSGLYRIFREPARERWFADGVYD